MIERRDHLERIRLLLGEFPVVGLIGARQVGKTTLAQSLAAGWQGPVTRFDLEDHRDRARLAEPMRALEGLEGLVLIDEVHHAPDLFPALRVLADRSATPARFLILGSASPDLLRQGSETLAGRIAYHELGGLDGSEVAGSDLERLWVRGGFPRSFLAATEPTSLRWRQAFVRNFLERDLVDLGLRLPAETLRRFWSMIAHYHGQTWNGAELARALGVSEGTVRNHLDLLCSTFMLRRLQPWHENLGKRQVKAPKIYLTDTGLLHALLDIADRHALLGHPKVGASWEGFALGEVASALGLRPEDCYFWALHSGAELDLLVIRGGRRRGFEFKHTEAPAVTRSMHSALQTLELDELVVVHAGRHAFPLAERTRAVPLASIREEFGPGS